MNMPLPPSHTRLSFMQRHITRAFTWVLFAVAMNSPDCAGAAPLTAYTVPVAPWTFPEHPARGIAPEYLRYLFDTAQVDANISTLPYLRAINGLRDGSNIAALLIPDSERDVFALRLCEVTTIKSGLLYKKSRFKNMTLENLDGLTVGVQRGTHALDKLANVPKLRREMIDSIDQGVRMLQVDRLDASFLSNPGIGSMMQSLGLSQDDYGWLEIDSAPVIIYISRKSPLAADDAALKRMKAVCEGPGKQVMQKLMQIYQ